MFNFRSLFFALFSAVIASGCGAKLVHFQGERCINMALVGSPEHLSQLDSGTVPITGIKKVYVHQAVLKEMLVEQNQITDFGLINEASSAKALDRHVNGFSNILYFFTFDLEPKQHRVAILMSTSFAKEKCIGIGPVYIGSVSDDDSLKRNVFKALRILDVSYLEKEDIFVLNRSKQILETSLKFIMDKGLLPVTPEDSAKRTEPFNLVRVMQGLDNKISGPEKQVVYRIGPLFGDADALKFTFFKSF